MSFFCRTSGNLRSGPAQKTMELISAGNWHTDQKWLLVMIIQMWEPIAQLLKQYSNIDIVQKKFPLFPPFIKWHSTIVWHLVTEICVCLPKRNIQRSEYVSHVTHEWKPLQLQQSPSSQVVTRLIYQVPIFSLLQLAGQMVLTLLSTLWQYIHFNTPMNSTHPREFHC